MPARSTQLSPQVSELKARENILKYLAPKRLMLCGFAALFAEKQRSLSQKSKNAGDYRSIGSVGA